MASYLTELGEAIVYQQILKWDVNKVVVLYKFDGRIVFEVTERWPTVDSEDFLQKQME